MVVLVVEMVILDMAVVVVVVLVLVLVLCIYMTLGVSASPPVVFWLRFATVSP